MGYYNSIYGVKRDVSCALLRVTRSYEEPASLLQHSSPNQKTCQHFYLILAATDMEGDRRAVIYAVSGVFTGLELFAVIMRIVARRMGQVNWNNDNWFIYLGVFWTLALNIVIISMLQKQSLKFIQDW